MTDRPFGQRVSITCNGWGRVGALTRFVGLKLREHGEGFNTGGSIRCSAGFRRVFQFSSDKAYPAVHTVVSAQADDGNDNRSGNTQYAHGQEPARAHKMDDRKAGDEKGDRRP